MDQTYDGCKTMASCADENICNALIACLRGASASPQNSNLLLAAEDSHTHMEQAPNFPNELKWIYLANALRHPIPLEADQQEQLDEEEALGDGQVELQGEEEAQQ